MKRIIILLFTITFLYSYSDFAKIGARQLGAGNSKVILSDDVNSAFLNPAGLGTIKRTALSVSFTLPYWTENLYSGYFSFVFPTELLNISVSSHLLFVGKEYSERLFNISASKSFSPLFTTGINLKLFNLSVAPGRLESPQLVQNLFKISFDIGVISKINKSFVFGLTLKNIFEPKIAFFTDTAGEYLDRILMAGLGYYPIEEFLLFAEIKYIREKLEFLTGCEFAIYNTIFLRAGYWADNYTFGIGIRTKYITISFGLSAHRYLGNTYLIDLIFEL